MTAALTARPSQPNPGPKSPARTRETRRITVITEAVLNQQLTRDLSYLGARVLSVQPCRAEEGASAVPSPSSGAERIRVECVADEAVVDHINDYLRSDLYRHFFMVAYAEPVEIIRA
jgi:hypothetical protein